MLSYTIVTGKATQPNGQPAAGVLVTATLSANIQNGRGFATAAVPYTAVTSRFGDWSLTLPATTDNGTNPDNAYYTITEPVSGLDVQVVVPASTVSIPVSALPAAPGESGAVTSVNGETGAVVLTASSVGADPAGAAAAAVEGTVNPTTFILPFAASAPATPSEGEAYFDTGLSKIGIYNGSAWVYTAALS